jgi:hypothetical protein
MKKYKCLDCGHQFEGDISTTQCPECGSPNIKPVGGGVPPIVWQVLAGLGVLVLIVILLKGCPPPTILMSLDTSSKEWLKISTQDITPANLKALYKIEITNDSTSQKDYQFFDGKSDFTSYSSRDLIAGVTYHFFLVDKKTGIQPENVKWNTNSYTKPLPPVQPEISISKEADCTTKTYTITISVTKGNADMFYLGNKSQSSNVFTNVPDDSTYVIKACDTPNGLYSEEHRVECATITEFHITEAQIQEVLDQVSKRQMKPGDALAKINEGSNIRLTAIIDGNAKLHGALEFSYSQQKKYYVRAVIESNDCSDIIRSITLSSSR